MIGEAGGAFGLALLDRNMGILPLLPLLFGSGAQFEVQPAMGVSTMMRRVRDAVGFGAD